MLGKTRGVILHTVKFGDHGLIVTLYTVEYGRQSYIMNAVRGTKSGNKAAILQPLFILEAEVYLKKSREIQRMKEFRLVNPYVSIPFDIRKSTQMLFLAEILYRILQEEERNPGLYHFIEHSLLFFDLMEEGVSHFHLWFLAHLTEYLGIYPGMESGSKGWFDMKTGNIVTREPLHSAFMNPETTEFLKMILSLDINQLNVIRINSTQRNLLMEKLLDYLHLHFENLGHLKSWPVLKAVFE